MNWIIENWDSILAVSGSVLGLSVSIAHMAHKEQVAQHIEQLQKIVNELQLTSKLSKNVTPSSDVTTGSTSQP